MSTIDPELLGCFIEEAGDLLLKWEAVCLDLEKNPSEDNWNALFRTAHNIKGTSRWVGLDSIGAFVHKVEDGITLAKQGRIELSPELFGKRCSKLKKSCKTGSELRGRMLRRRLIPLLLSPIFPLLSLVPKCQGLPKSTMKLMRCLHCHKFKTRLSSP